MKPATTKSIATEIYANRIYAVSEVNIIVPKWTCNLKCSYTNNNKYTNLSEKFSTIHNTISLLHEAAIHTL